MHKIFGNARCYCARRGKPRLPLASTSGYCRRVCSRRHRTSDRPCYRAYIIDHDGHIQRFEPIVCADDDTTIAAAKRLVDGHDVEVWQGARKVTLLRGKADSEK